MKAPPEHKKYLNMTFAFGCSRATLSVEEEAALVDRGAWMESLALGLIQPVTPAQEQFLRVARGEAEPKTFHERAWSRLTARREYEREQRMAPPTEPKPTEKYDIQEWDADRWW